MFGRLFTGVVIVFWAVTMTWLFLEKVIPPLLGGDPPDYTSDIAEPRDEQPPESWRLRWNGKTIGYAAARTDIRPSGRVERYTYVEFQDLPLEALLSELLGPMAAVIKPMLQEGRDLKLDMMVATRMRFNEMKRLTGFDTTIDLAGAKDFLKLRGGVGEDGKLLVIAQMSNGSAGRREHFRHSVQLPPEALIEGSLVPRPELRDLHVGQTWTIPVFRAFPPNSPVQILQAEVERHDPFFLWGNDEVETLEVVYRSDAGSGVQATRKPISREWVRVTDGLTLRQQIRFSGVEMTFERLTESELQLRSDRIDELVERLWVD